MSDAVTVQRQKADLSAWQHLAAFAAVIMAERNHAPVWAAVQELCYDCAPTTNASAASRQEIVKAGIALDKWVATLRLASCPSEYQEQIVAWFNRQRAEARKMRDNGDFAAILKLLVGTEPSSA